MQPKVILNLPKWSDRILSSSQVVYPSLGIVNKFPLRQTDSSDGSSKAHKSLITKTSKLLPEKVYSVDTDVKIKFGKQ